MSPLSPSRRPTSTAADTPRLDVDALVTDARVRIVVCCGSGGVGKTTTAAAIGLRAAEAGRRVVVLTIDPARRLAQSLGLAGLDAEPREVPGVDTRAGGRLEAMMLDMKRTFDEVVEAHATPEKAAQILANPFYEALSSSFAGTQEYMAMEKLGQLHGLTGPNGTPRWDLVVVDTPPSRSALDFLDAPARLGSFLDGRFIALLLAPAKAGGRAYGKVLGMGMGVAAGAVSKIVGASTLHDLQGLVAALDTVFGGFRRRADQTFELLRRPETAFVVVASPERDALLEAGYFVDRLRTDGMPLAGVVVNRMRHLPATAWSADAARAAAATLRARGGDEAGSSETIVADLLDVHADLAAEARRHRRAVTDFSTRHTGVPLVEVPLAATDIHDLDGLRQIGGSLGDR